MYDSLKTLSRREKEVLRLLLVGHDAKSVARSLDLSIHTVNELLRDARRKLGVSSSREAARLLAEIEQPPNLFVDKKIGGEQQPPNLSGDKKKGVDQPASLKHSEQPNRRQAVGHSIAWLAGGMLVMSLMIAALVLSLAMNGSGQAQGPAPRVLARPQAGMDLMPFADTNSDQRVTPEEYKIFSEQGWGFAAQNNDEVNFARLDPRTKLAFLGVVPNAAGIITRKMYIDAIPNRFKMLDRNGDGVLSSIELNGRVFQD